MGTGRNLRFALRTLRKSPAFSITTVLLVGLGVGAVTTIFTLVDHVLLRPLSYPDSERLVLIQNGSHSGVAFEEFRQMRSVDLWAAAHSDQANLVGQGEPIRIEQASVSEDFFRMFGGRPALGRVLLEDDFEAASNVVLSHGTWVRIFGADPDVVGRTIRVDQDAVTIVGVLSADFVPPEGMVDRTSTPDMWRPIDWSRDGFANVDMHILKVVGRVAQGVTLADVTAEMEQTTQRLARRFPQDLVDRDGNPFPTPPANLQEVTTRRVRAGLGLLLGAVALLLVVACLNVAHLFLARGLGRVREMAVRRALGADTLGLVSQLLIESVVLGLAGGAVGVLLATVGVRGLLGLNPYAIPWATQVSIDMRVLAFAGAVSVATALAFGLLPALRSVGRDITEELRGRTRTSGSGRSTSRLRSGLVIAEVATSLVLVTQAGLLLKSFMNVHALDAGFTTAGVWTMPLTPTGMQPQEYVTAMNRVRRSLASVPGVSSAGYGLTQPFQFTGSGRCCWSTSSLSVDGEEQESTRIMIHPVSEGYFSTLEIPMPAGSPWVPSEAGQEPWPGVLSEGFAVELFGSAERAVNRVVEVGGAGTPVRITGVSADTRHYGLDQDPPRSLYLPVEHLPFDIPMAHMAVRVQGAPSPTLASDLRTAVWSASPNLPVPMVRSMDDWVELSTATRRFDSVLFGTFGVLALLLAAAGLYGTLLYTVGEQRQELGIRLALGAGRSQVERQVVSRGLMLAVFGSAIGLSASWAVGRFLESRLYDLRATDPITLALAVSVLLGVAAMASWIPARRAGRTDPLQTLKAE
jgi:predicted permease